MPDYASEPLHATVLQAFARHGVTGEVRYVPSAGVDEAIFVVAPRGAATMDERDVTVTLTSILTRKVWVATESEAWRGKTAVL